MNRSLKIILGAFVIVALAQWLVPAQMIWKREEVLQKGIAYRFLTQPVDPSNPFIGRYITLNFQENSIAVKPSVKPVLDETIYVLLANDSAGFAHIKNISIKEPVNETAYVKAKVDYVSDWGDSSVVHIDYPFDEFYMEETKAPKAEDAYRAASSDTAQTTYAQVKIWKGMAVTENVFINDKPLTSYFK